jgi:hypothetical protein
MATENSTLDTDLIEQLRAIRRALHIGLESFGEVERVTDRYEAIEACGLTLDRELRPVHPTGAPNTVGVFATALRYLEHMEPELST